MTNLLPLSKLLWLRAVSPLDSAHLGNAVIVSKQSGRFSTSANLRAIEIDICPMRLSIYSGLALEQGGDVKTKRVH